MKRSRLPAGLRFRVVRRYNDSEYTVIPEANIITRTMASYHVAIP